jgi:hypothetical protein
MGHLIDLMPHNDDPMTLIVDKPFNDPTAIGGLYDVFYLEKIV